VNTITNRQVISSNDNLDAVEDKGELIRFLDQRVKGQAQEEIKYG